MLAALATVLDIHTLSHPYQTAHLPRWNVSTSTSFPADREEPK